MCLGVKMTLKNKHILIESKWNLNHDNSRSLHETVQILIESKWNLNVSTDK